MQLLDAYRIAMFSTLGTTGFTARIGRNVIVAFRGTVPDQLLNWLTNLNYSQVPDGSSLVHQGFFFALDLVWEQVLDQVSKLQVAGDEIWLTGHSLGGALAMLAGRRLATRPAFCGVYTFGAPRAGNPAFAASYPVSLHRVERTDDLVCHLPLSPLLMSYLKPSLEWFLPSDFACLMPKDVSYRHAGILNLIEIDGKVYPEIGLENDTDESSNRLLQVADSLLRHGPAGVLRSHSMESYLAALRSNC